MKLAENMDMLKEIVVDGFYNLEEEILIETDLTVDARTIIDLFKDKGVFIFNNSYRCKTIRRNMGTHISINIDYSQGYKIYRTSTNRQLVHKLNTREREVLDRIDKIYSRFKMVRPSEDEIIKLVHDYLINISSYDIINFKRGNDLSISHTPYGLLFKGKGLCSAYAETFMIFMAMANISSYFIIGQIVNESEDNVFGRLGHAWNMVNINGKHYHIDISSNKLISQERGRISYRYFNIKDKAISKTHKWNRQYYPLCLPDC